MDSLVPLCGPEGLPTGDLERTPNRASDVLLVLHKPLAHAVLAAGFVRSLQGGCARAGGRLVLLAPSELAPLLTPLVDAFVRWPTVDRPLVAEDRARLASGFRFVVADLGDHSLRDWGVEALTAFDGAFALGVGASNATFAPVPEVSGTRHDLERYRQWAAALSSRGVPFRDEEGTAVPRLRLERRGDEERSGLQRLLTQFGLGSGYVVWVPSANARSWPLRKQESLLAAFPEDRFVALGERDAAPAVAKVAASNVVDLCGRLSFREMLQVLEGARACFVSGSESPWAHLAPALGVPTVCVDSQMWADEYLPYPRPVEDHHVKVLRAPAFDSCSGCRGICSRESFIASAWRGGAPCVREIETESVRLALEDAIASGLAQRGLATAL